MILVCCDSVNNNNSNNGSEIALYEYLLLQLENFVIIMNNNCKYHLKGMLHVPSTELNDLTCVISFQINKPKRFR